MAKKSNSFKFGDTSTDELVSALFAANNIEEPVVVSESPDVDAVLSEIKLGSIKGRITKLEKMVQVKRDLLGAQALKKELEAEMDAVFQTVLYADDIVTTRNRIAELEKMAFENKVDLTDEIAALHGMVKKAIMKGFGSGMILKKARLEELEAEINADTEVLADMQKALGGAK